jgi:single-strand DNA-binding protein
MSINRVVVSGNLTRDPELRATASGMAVLKLGIAVNDRRKNQQTGEWEDVPNFFDVTIFGQRGESLSRFLSKGSKVAIEGKLRWSQWETPDGDKRSKVEIIADDIEFMSSRNEGGFGGGSGGYDAPAAPTKKPETFEDDIPF